MSCRPALACLPSLSVLQDNRQTNQWPLWKGIIVFSKTVVDYSDQRSFGSRMRARRIAPFLEMLRAASQRDREVKILDVGGTRQYWRIVPETLFEELNLHVTLVNIQQEESQSGRFTFTEGDACDLSRYSDNAFDIVHSNSVIEHVGDWSRMCDFARETRRLAPEHWIQTPYFWFPVEPHCLTPFYHWLPHPIRIKLIHRFRLGNWERRKTIDAAVRAVESARLLDQAMFQELYPDSEIRFERLMLWPKSMIAVRRNK